MPTRKQRRRQAKAKRHEYEYVLVDEGGNEVLVDPAELRLQKEKEREKQPKQAAGKGKQPVARDRRGRPLRQPRKPSWRRAIITGLAFIVILLVVTSVIGSKKPSIASRVVLAAVYGGFGIPFFYWMDRANYRRWEKATGRGQDTKKQDTKKR